MTPGTSLALGVDGGNSTAVAAVVGLDGRLAGWARGGPSDRDVTGPGAIVGARAGGVAAAVATEAPVDPAPGSGSWIDDLTVALEPARRPPIEVRP